jgi:hypothetical protein
MTQPLPLLLMIRGNKFAAMSAAHAHGIAVTILRSTIGETIAKADWRFRPQIEAWFNEPPNHRDGDLMQWC